MNFISNPQIEQAFDYVRNTNKNIFLTGKAGTGKTTFLHEIRKEGFKRMVVVAPTGVAAINAGGMTIHSFFQLPFGPQLPGVVTSENRFSKLRAKKIDLIKSLDLLVIDEISMVRADMLDGIDRVLKQYRDRTKPFGGVQLLMIGDLHQLPPVVKHQEWELLRDYYQTAYFFGSLALQQTGIVTIQLKHIYRQNDQEFIALLNKVRNNQMDNEVLQALNSRYSTNLPGDDENYITLTAMNKPADKINIEKLSSIKEKVRVYKAIIADDFPKHAYPTHEMLELKMGAQVMFVKNDLSPEKRYYNGKIGKVVGLEKETIKVKCKDDPSPILVSPAEWTNVKYDLNKKTKEVSENVVGTFTQFPLKLAWAITIHKSQGLTFEKVIIDAANAFAHGQTYVALSRCKSFEGIVLRSQLAFASVKTDSVVQTYTNEADKNPPTEVDLKNAKREYQQAVVIELFDFKSMTRYFSILNRLFLEHDKTLTEAAVGRFLEIEDKAIVELAEMADKFLPQLYRYFQEEAMPEDNEQLRLRLQKAGQYFSDKINQDILPEINTLDIITDNQTIRDKATEGVKNLIKELMTKSACFANCKKEFKINEYIKTKLDIALNDKIGRTVSANANKSATPSSPSQAAKDSAHPELYQTIRNWRDAIASTEGRDAYTILQMKTLGQLVEYLPTTETNLKKVSGIGKVKAENYGEEIMEIIKQYVAEKKIPSDQIPVKEKKVPTKTPTKKISYDAFRAGKTVEEIAKERDMVPSTIQSHLGFFISTGEIHIHEMIDETKVAEIAAYLKAHTDKPFKEVKDHFGERVSYGELNMVRSHLAREDGGV